MGRAGGGNGCPRLACYRLWRPPPPDLVISSGNPFRNAQRCMHSDPCGCHTLHTQPAVHCLRSQPPGPSKTIKTTKQEYARKKHKGAEWFESSLRSTRADKEEKRARKADNRKLEVEAALQRVEKYGECAGWLVGLCVD